jgi:hypothetical protein
VPVDIALLMEEVSTSETSVIICHTAQHIFPAIVM